MILRKIIRTNWVVGLCVVLAILLLVAVVEAKQKEKKKEKKQEKQEEEVVEVKQVKGMVVSLSPRRKPKAIGIACGEGEEGYDIFFRIDKGVQLNQIKSLSKIKLGQIVLLKYHEVIRTTGEGEEVKKEIERIAKVITLVRSATEKLMREPEETE